MVRSFSPQRPQSSSRGLQVASRISDAWRGIAGGGASGGGGGSLPLASMLLHFDASTLELNEGDAVDFWSDSSGNDIDASQPTANNRPIYRAAGFAGQPSVEFDGTDRLNFTLPAGSFDYTIFMVVNPNAVDSTRPQLTLSGNYFVVTNRNGSSAIHVAGGYKTNGPSAVGEQVYEYRMEQAINETRIYKDGVSVGTGAYGTQEPLNDVANYAAIGNFSAGTSNGFSGQIAEIIVYTTALTTEERASVYEYLDNKYGG